MAPKRKAEAFAPRDGTAPDVELSPWGRAPAAPSEEEQREAWASLAARLRATRGGEMHPDVGVGWGGAVGRGLVALGPIIPSGRGHLPNPTLVYARARDALRSDVGRLVVDAAERARPLARSPSATSPSPHTSPSTPPRVPNPPFAPYHRLLDAETFGTTPPRGGPGNDSTPS